MKYVDNGGWKNGVPTEDQTLDLSRVKEAPAFFREPEISSRTGSLPRVAGCHSGAGSHHHAFA
jgi:hypothetical protein